MDKKKLAKRQLISILSLFFALFTLTLVILLGIYFSGKMTADFTVQQLIMISVASAYLPCGVYAGICTCFLKIKELNNKQSVAFVVLFPLIFALTVAVGLVMVVPLIIKSIIALAKG